MMQLQQLQSLSTEAGYITQLSTQGKPAPTFTSEVLLSTILLSLVTDEIPDPKRHLADWF